MSRALSSLRAFAGDIKLAHSIFALPFAGAAAWMVHQQAPVTPAQWAWLLVAMVGARSSAMGFNRIVDRGLDAENPRTKGRALPSGRLSPGGAWAITLAFTGLFLLAAAMLHPTCLRLSPLALLVLWGYSLTKRFTALCHLVLGLALGLAPVAVWIALTGGVQAPALLLGGAVLCWVAGFDVLYSLQDRDFDRRRGLHSLPVALGEVGALRVSAALHLLTVLLLAALPLSWPLGWPYGLGVAGIAVLLSWEHRLVRPGDLSRLDQAFFALNGWVGVGLLVAVILGTIS